MRHVARRGGVSTDEALRRVSPRRRRERRRRERERGRDPEHRIQGNPVYVYGENIETVRKVELWTGTVGSGTLKQNLGAGWDEESGRLETDSFEDASLDGQSGYVRVTTEAGFPIRFFNDAEITVLVLRRR